MDYFTGIDNSQYLYDHGWIHRRRRNIKIFEAFHNRIQRKLASLTNTEIRLKVRIIL